MNRRRDDDRDGLRERLAALFAEPSEGPRAEDQIAGALGLRGRARRELRPLLESMVRNGEIVRVRQNRYTPGRPADLVTGVLDVLRSGDGLLRPLDGSAEVFVGRDDLGTALPSDRVVVRLDPGRADPEAAVRRTGKVIRILERSGRALVGTLRRTPRFFYVVPIDPAYARDFYVADPKGAAVGDRVVIQFSEWENRHVSPEADILEVIGPATEPSLDTLAVIRHYNLRDRFPAEAQGEAERAPERLAAAGARRDCRDRFVFTIDPETSRDYDDALSLESDSAGRRVLGVHIADVAHFVRPNGAMDREARLRGNSVYLPDRVLPMLPEQLSNGLCSLRPGEDRLAFTVWLTVEEDGAVAGAEFAKSVIRSRRRLTYEQAMAALREPPGAPGAGAPLAPDEHRVLHALHGLAQQFRRRRFAEEALDLDLPEYEVRIGPDGMIADIRRTVSDASHQLIEECMVAANEAVDRELSDAGIPLLHRVHEPPAPEKLAVLEVQLRELGLVPGDLSRRRGLAAFLAAVRSHPLADDAMLAVLKSLKRAVYDARPLGHFGLAKRYYAHFTSPIRRYPDLVVHRQLEARLARRAPPYGRAELDALGPSCSRTEQVADLAEKSLLEIKTYRFLEQQLAQGRPRDYAAVVVRVRNFGVFVQLVELQVQGLVHVSALARDFLRYDERRQTLRAGRQVFARGTRLTVRPARVDFDKRQIDFVPSAPGAEGPSRPATRPPAGRPHRR